MKRTPLARRGHPTMLSPRATAVMEAGFADGLTYAEIAKCLAQLGEYISERTLSRRCIEWRTRRERDEMIARLSQLRRCSFSAEEVIGILRRIDTAPGWYNRARRRLHRELASFLKEPGEARIREIVEVCFSYAVGSNLARRPQLVAQKEGEAQRVG